jgi:uncharacterized RDD family membrane protein YckC
MTSRVRAAAYDYGVIVVYGVAVTATVQGADRFLGLAIPDSVTADAERMDVLATVTMILPVMFYFAFTEASVSGASIGKRRAGLRVVGLDDQRLPLIRSLLRSALKVLPWQAGHTAVFQASLGGREGVAIGASVPAYSLVGVYIVSALRSSERRSVYDRIAGSRVVAHR